jgi:hypothetical protein
MNLSPFTQEQDICSWDYSGAKPKSTVEVAGLK